MSDSFSSREKSFEAKFKMDEELKFKAESRRNKLLGLWAAEQMGMTSDEASDYAKEVVIADLEEPGYGDVVRKVLADFRDKGVALGEGEIISQIEALYPVAVQQLQKEYPEPLSSDHESR